MDLLAPDSCCPVVLSFILLLLFFCSLRSAYPHTERSYNPGCLSAAAVDHGELHQGLGVSIKVTVISENFREPITFTCDSESCSSCSQEKLHT